MAGDFVDLGHGHACRANDRRHARSQGDLGVVEGRVRGREIHHHRGPREGVGEIVTEVDLT